jgi:hypothetical protein
MERKNLLYKTKSYLMGSMEFSDGRGWREEVKKELDGRNITFLDPYVKPFIHEVAEDESSRQEMAIWRENGDFDRVAKRMKRVRSDDLRCIDISDWLLAFIKPKVASWGTGEEIPSAIRQKKAVFLAIDDPKGVKACPFWFFGMIPHKYIYGSLEEAIETIKGIDEGRVDISSDRWHLLKHSYR